MIELEPGELAVLIRESDRRRWLEVSYGWGPPRLWGPGWALDRLAELRGQRREEVMGKTYHGWIYVEREAGMRETFYVEIKNEKGERLKVRQQSAGACVEFFDERTKKLVNIEATPLGYRVYTMEEKVADNA